MTNKDSNLIEPLVNSFLEAGSMVTELLFKAVSCMAFKASANLKGGTYAEVPVFAEIPNHVAYKKVKTDDPLSFIIGVNSEGKYTKVDLLKDNHLLIVGATGQGKSNVLACIIKALKDNNPIGSIKFIMVDFKRMDLNIMYDANYAIGSVIDDAGRLDKMLSWIEGLIKLRNEEIVRSNKKNWHEFNKVAVNKIQPIIVFIDELIQVTAGNKHIQDKLYKIMALSRASGIYFICTTQDATKEALGRCKIHFPQTIGLKVATTADSMTAIGSPELESINISGRAYLKRRAELEEVQIMEVVD